MVAQPDSGKGSQPDDLVLAALQRLLDSQPEESDWPELAGLEDGPLKDALQMLGRRLAGLHSSLESRTRELEMLLAVNQAIDRQLRPDAVLQLIADGARRLTNTRLAVVYLLEGDSLVLANFSGEHGSDIEPGYRMPVDGSVAGLAIQTGRPYRIAEAHKDPRVYRDAIERSGLDSFLIVPLVSLDQPVGVISVANKIHGELNAEDEHILARMASSAVISLENARLYEQAQQSAALAERNRLARDLHDAVSQTLFSVSLIGDVLPQLWEEDPEEGRRRLEELRRLTHGAMAEMRTLLMELRPSALAHAELGSLVRQLASAFSARAQVPVELNLEPLAELPVEVKTAFYRILQEALNNVARHAAASQVRITLTNRQGWVRLEVRDDGRGFDPQSVQAGRLGLGIMRERAESIGAAFSLISGPGEGTEIQIIWKDGWTGDD